MFAQSAIEWLGIPIFNRIEEFDFLLDDISKVPVHENDLKRLTSLETFSVKQKGRQTLTDSSSQFIEKKISTCRVDSIEKTGNQVSIKLNSNPTAFCCSN